MLGEIVLFENGSSHLQPESEFYVEKRERARERKKERWKERERERDGESEREVNPFPCFNLELCFRVIKGTSTFANHQAGRAILLPPFLFKPTTRVDEYQVTYRMKWHFPQKAGKEASSHKMQGATGYKFPAQSYCSIVGGGQHPWTRRAINALHQIHILF